MDALALRRLDRLIWVLLAMIAAIVLAAPAVSDFRIVWHAFIAPATACALLIAGAGSTGIGGPTRASPPGSRAPRRSSPWPRWARRCRISPRALKVAMLTATPVDGSHYFIDVFAGVALAALCLVAAQAIAARAGTRVTEPAHAHRTARA